MSRSIISSVDPREEDGQLVDRFLQDLQRQETSPNTRRSYQLDLLHFAVWFARTIGEGFSPEGVTPTDVREYRSHLISTLSIWSSSSKTCTAGAYLVHEL